jgi:hypothetical protein
VGLDEVVDVGGHGEVAVGGRVRGVAMVAQVLGVLLGLGELNEGGLERAYDGVDGSFKLPG